MTTENRGCPCHYVGPCMPMCTCVNHHYSAGCLRCATYGSLEQRTAKAKQLTQHETMEPMCYVRNGEISRWNGLGSMGFSGPLFKSPWHNYKTEEMNNDGRND